MCTQPTTGAFKKIKSRPISVRGGVRHMLRHQRRSLLAGLYAAASLAPLPSMAFSKASDTASNPKPTKLTQPTRTTNAVSEVASNPQRTKLVQLTRIQTYSLDI